MRHISLTLVIGVLLYAGRAESQTFKTLLQFTGTGGTASGANPQGSLVLSGTTLYGMTQQGGANRDGNIFSFGIDGTNYKNLLSFTGAGGTASGAIPGGSLTLSGSTLYGMTSLGAANNYGNIFSVGNNGANYQNLVSFTGAGGTASGSFSQGNLVLSETTLYGMTETGGYFTSGNIFSTGTGGTNFRNLVAFTASSGTAIGRDPWGSLLLNGTTLYGMTQNGGVNGYGNLFSVGADGTSFRNLVSFTGTGGIASGAYPRGSLILSGTTLYGMTQAGGAKGIGNIFSVGTDGTSFNTLRSFTDSSGSAIGYSPLGSLILSDTTLYGMTNGAGGATHGFGNIFKLGIDGSAYQSLYSFTGGTDGGQPVGDLTLSGGTLFGMTSGGGANHFGTLFALTVPAQLPNRERWR